MKNTIIILSALAVIAESGYSQGSTSNQSMIIPLKAGRQNPPVQFEALHIEPIYLIVQNENDRSPNVALGLNVAVNDKKYSTTLTYSYNNPKIHYPIAFENYIFGLEINNDSVSLTVEKNDFGKVFFLAHQQKAIIGNLSISFEDVMGEWSNDPHGNYSESREHFTILISDDDEQKEFRFGALYARGREKILLLNSERGNIKDDEDELLLEWKNYQISVLDAGGTILKLKVLNKK
jgi:hypothetical protein